MQEIHAIIPPALILDKLNEEFTYDELRNCIEEPRKAIHLASDCKSSAKSLPVKL